MALFCSVSDCCGIHRNYIKLYMQQEMQNIPNHVEEVRSVSSMYTCHYVFPLLTTNIAVFKSTKRGRYCL